MYLEPDMENGYSYLEAVKEAVEHYTEYIEDFKEKDKNRNSIWNEEFDFYRKNFGRFLMPG